MGRCYIRHPPPDHCPESQTVVILTDPVTFVAPNQENAMKPGLHPDSYRVVVFKDMSNEHMFFGKSCTNTKDSVKWEDGNEYPLIKLDISNTSHPYYTGKMMLIDTAGRVDKFKKRFAKHNDLSGKPNPAPSEAPASEAPASDAK